MSLRYIFGSYGTGKTHLCIDEITEQCDSRKKILYIVPEQFTLESDKALLEKKGAFVNVEVLGFSHLAYSVISSMGTNGRIMLNGAGRAMLIKKIILDLRKQLLFYGSAADKQGFADRIGDTITELMQYNVSLGQLEEFAESRKDTNLGHKLKDICLIYKSYIEYMSNEYLAGDGALDYLTKLISRSSVKGSSVWIDGFRGFTPQEKNIIAELLKYCEQVNIVFSIDTAQTEYFDLSPLDKDFEVKKNINYITNLARENDVKIEKPVLCEKVYKNGTPAINYLKKAFYDRNVKIAYTTNDRSVRVHKYSDMYSEIDAVCSEICSLVNEHGCRYRDIGVIMGSPDYNVPLSLAFKKFGIPDFLDSRREISTHILITFMLSAIDIVAYGWDNSAIFRFLKTGYTSVEPKAIYELENYVIANGINTYKWHKEWKYGFRKDENDTLRPVREDILASRDALFGILSPLTDNFTPTRLASVRDISEKLFEIVINCGIKEKLEEEINLADKNNDRVKSAYYTEVWNTVLAVLDKMSEILGDEKVHLKEYSSILSAGLSASTVGIVPPTQDYINLGDIERTRLHDIKALFILGANDSNIPPKYNETGVFTDKDREMLTAENIELAPTSASRASRNLANIYANIIKPTEHLVVSYPVSSLRSDTLLPSSIVQRISELLPDAITENDSPDEQIEKNKEKSRLYGDYAFDTLIRNISRGDESEFTRKLFAYCRNSGKYSGKIDLLRTRLENNIPPQKLKASLLPQLWDSVINTMSVSKLENYASCPFKFYMSYVLRARDRAVYGMSNTDAGLIAHKLLEMFSNQLNYEKKDWTDVSREYSDKYVDDHIAEIAREYSADVYESNRNSEALEKLADAIKMSLWANTEQIKAGRFRPDQFEISFGSGKKIPAIEIELDNDKILKINGVIDRVDKMLTEDGKVYVKIVDYKSSGKKPDINSIYAGLQLQLVMYMNALCKDESINPAGMFYFEVDEPDLEEKENTEMTTEDYMLRRMGLRGIYDDSLKNDLDSVVLSSGKKKILRDIIESDSLGLSYEEFRDIMDFVLIKAKEMGNVMSEGRIDIKPVTDKYSACTYCPYKSVCDIDCRKSIEPEKIGNKKDENMQKIKEAVKKKK